MEFTTLTRRVAEIYDADMALVDPIPPLSGRMAGAAAMAMSSRRLRKPRPRPKRPCREQTFRTETLTPAALARQRKDDALKTPSIAANMSAFRLSKPSKSGFRRFRRRFCLFRYRNRFARSDAGQSGWPVAGSGAQSRLLRPFGIERPAPTTCSAALISCRGRLRWRRRWLC